MRLIAVVLLAFVGSSGALGLEAVERQIPGNENRNCYVNVWGAHAVTGGRCRFSNDVMTGIASLDPLKVICSRVDVRCRNSNDGAATSELAETTK